MRLDAAAKGVFPIAPTPFQSDGSIDPHSNDRMTDFYAECGCNGITILGVMGEAPKLDVDEAVQVARQVIGRSKLPVIVGVSSPGFAAMRRLSRTVMDHGAAGVIIAPPPSLRTDDQIVTYFRQAVEAIGRDIPWVLQDYPLALSVVITPGVIRTIVSENASCVMLKHEDWLGLDKITALRNAQSTGNLRPLSILCGNGGLFIDFELARGADGAMTGYAFPDMLVAMVKLSEEKKKNEAHDLFDMHLPLIRYGQQPGIGLAVRKYVMMRRGILASDAQRTPGASLGEIARAEVEYLLTRLTRHDNRMAPRT